MILLRDVLWIFAEGVVLFFITYFLARFVTEIKKKRNKSGL